MSRLTLSSKQAVSLAQASARYNIWVGAVRSGKSFISLLAFVDFIRHAPKQDDFVIIGKSLGSIKRNVLGPLKDMLEDEFNYSTGKGEAYLYNRTIHLIGANDERAEHKIRGPTFAGAYVDEITIIPQTVFVMLQSRLTHEGSKLFGTTNPDSPFHWLKTDLIDRAGELDVRVWNFTLEDNPSLTASYKANISKEYRGLWYDRYIRGQWVLAEGVIYDHFDRTRHVIDFPPGAADYYVCGVDYGTTNPTAFALIGCSERTTPNKWLEREYYWDSKKQLRQKTDTQYAEDLKKFLTGYPSVRAIYIDPSAVSFRVELQRQGFTGLFEAENEVLDGIRYHSMQLSNGTFKVCSNCTTAIQEYGTYRWDPNRAAKGEDKPIKENDHMMDAIRYALYTEWFRKEGPRLRPEDIERMRREVQGDERPGEGFGRFYDDKPW